MFTVISTPEFDEKLHVLYKEHPRLMEIKQAIEWLLHRSPTAAAGALHLGDNAYLWITAQLPVRDIPTVRIIYSVNFEHQIVKLITIDKHNTQSLKDNWTIEFQGLS